MIAATPSIRSLGNALRLLGVTLKQFRKVQAELGIIPVRLVDDVEEFDDADVQKMRERLAKGP